MHATIAILLWATGIALAQGADSRISRAELLESTRPLGEAYIRLLGAASRDSVHARRIERVFARMVEQAKRMWPEPVQWELVLVAKDVVPPFALPDGRIFIAPKWVARRRLGEAETALLIAHELAHVLAEHMLARVTALAEARPAYALRVADLLTLIEHDWHVARELEPLMRSQELEADRIGMAIVCAAGLPRSQALTLFDRMARAGRGSALVQSHDDPAERKVIVAEWARAQNLVCLD